MEVQSTKYKVLRTNFKGQALVLVLLSLAVVLTIVLFILLRTVTDIAVSSRQEESVRAFSAAEAGIEQALVSGVGVFTGSFANTSGFSADVTSFAEGSYDFEYPIGMNAGDTATNWFVAHDVNSNLTCGATTPCFTGTTMKVCWGKPGTGSGTATTPAVELSVFYEITPGDPS